VESNFTWEAQDPQPGDRDLFEYLVERKKAHCAAQSRVFVTLLRANPAPIPARIVCGSWVNGNKPVLHHWAEFYLEGIGWIPADVSLTDLAPARDRMVGFARLNADHWAGCPTCECPSGGWHFVGLASVASAPARSPSLEIFPKSLAWTDEQGQGATKALLIGRGFQPNEEIKLAVGYVRPDGSFREKSTETLKADRTGGFQEARAWTVKGIGQQWRVRARGAESNREAEVCFWTQ
jgi:hypothetical protein